MKEDICPTSERDNDSTVAAGLLRALERHADVERLRYEHDSHRYNDSSNSNH